MTTPGEKWTADYVAAWRSNDPGQIGALFGADARYFTNPDSEPRVGPGRDRGGVAGRSG